MSGMNGTTELTRQKSGQRLTNTKRLVVIGKLIDHLSQGYYTTNELSRITGLTRKMVDTYRPVADDLIAKKTLNRNNIRNLQITRTYNIIEKLMGELDLCESIKEKTLIYNQIAKFSQHLALITGLNVETHVNVDHAQLVIVRADNGKKPVMLNETQDNEKQHTEAEIITIKDEPELNQKTGHSVK